jgi:uncharacterized protein
MLNILLAAVMLTLTMTISIASAQNADKLPRLFNPIKENDFKNVSALITKNPSLLKERSKQGLSPLMYAAYMERAEIVALLRDASMTLDFFEACIVGDTPTVQRYLTRGQDVNARAADGFTPLGLAVFFRQPATARVLIEAGADINAKADNTFQVAPIHASVARSDLATLQLLLLRGANPNLTQQRLMRPIHEASAAGNLAAVAMLIMFGADIYARNEEGKTASDFAKDNGHLALAKRLITLAKLEQTQVQHVMQQ